MFDDYGIGKRKFMRLKISGTKEDEGEWIEILKDSFKIWKLEKKK